MSWIQTISGVAFDLVDSVKQEYRIEDIAHALSNLCRFNGHTREFYSVAQHSVLVSYTVELAVFDQQEQIPIESRGGPEAVEELRIAGLWGLLHDASEAYLGDVTSPLKTALRKTPFDVSTYDRLEAQIMSGVCLAFGLPPVQPALVREMDLRILATERRDVMRANCARDWQLRYEPLPGVSIEPCRPGPARDLFLHRFAELTPRK